MPTTNITSPASRVHLHMFPHDFLACNVEQASVWRFWPQRVTHFASTVRTWMEGFTSLSASRPALRWRSAAVARQMVSSGRPHVTTAGGAGRPTLAPQLPQKLAPAASSSPQKAQNIRPSTRTVYVRRLAQSAHVRQPGHFCCDNRAPGPSAAMRHWFSRKCLVQEKKKVVTT